MQTMGTVGALLRCSPETTDEEAVRIATACCFTRKHHEKGTFAVLPDSLGYGRSRVWNDGNGPYIYLKLSFG